MGHFFDHIEVENHFVPFRKLIYKISQHFFRNADLFVYVLVIFISGNSSTICNGGFFLNFSIAVLIMIRFIHPSNEPFPVYCPIEVKILINPSCNVSSASAGLWKNGDIMQTFLQKISDRFSLLPVCHPLCIYLFSVQITHQYLL